MTKRLSEKQIEEIRELNRLRWNALVAREEQDIRAADAAANKRRSRIRAVK
jgi:hypothetical protein